MSEIWEALPALVERHRGEMERALGMALRHQLGCGTWGFHGHLAVGSRGVETGMGGVRYVVYPAYVDREFRPELTEHIGFRWVDGELPASTHPGVEKALREL